MSKSKSMTTILLLYFSLFCQFQSGWAQLNKCYMTYVTSKNDVAICKDGEFCDLDRRRFNLRAINKVVFSGYQGNLHQQMAGMLSFLKKNKKVRIHILELQDFPDLVEIDTLIREFERVSVLVINRCPKLTLERIIKMINDIHDRTLSESNEAASVKARLRAYKKKFKARPSIYYLSTLVLVNQNLQSLVAPGRENLGTFNYLEELRIISPKDSLGGQAFVNSLIEKYLIIDTLIPYNSIFPNLKYLTFKDCELHDLPAKFRFLPELISLDLSGNNFTQIPNALDSINARALLSVNLSNNYLETLDSTFLDNYCKAAPKNDRFSRYLFLDNNCLPKTELEKLRHYEGKFNTISFNDNNLTRKELVDVVEILERNGSRIAQFMTGARRYVNDYKPEIEVSDRPSKCRPPGY